MNHIERGVYDSTLGATDRGTMHPGSFCKVFMRKSLALALSRKDRHKALCINL